MPKYRTLAHNIYAFPLARVMQHGKKQLPKRAQRSYDLEKGKEITLSLSCHHVGRGGTTG